MLITSKKLYYFFEKNKYFTTSLLIFSLKKLKIFNFPLFQHDCTEKKEK